MAWAIAFAPADARPFNILYKFCSQSGCVGGPLAALVGDQSGNFYGAANGGAQTSGAVFELASGSNGTYGYSLLYSFCAQPNCADGSVPQGSLIADKAGDLYGVTGSGGAEGVGEVFELVPNVGRNQWTLEVLYSFCSKYNCSDGAYPLGGLTYAGAASGAFYDGTSPLFGTTDAEGAQGGGVAYELQPGTGGWAYQVIYNFCSQSDCSDGFGPWGPLNEDALGNLYGTTEYGGNGNWGGTLFELSPANSGWNETVLYKFCSLANCADGLNPVSGVTIDASGNLFGVTPTGGNICVRYSNGCGVLYEVTPNGISSKESVLYTFCALSRCIDGYAPFAPPAIDARGNLYGTAVNGGIGFDGINHYGSGVVYWLTGTTYQVLHTFCAKPDCRDGADPEAGLLRDRKGRLFGATTFGGKNSIGGDTGSGLIYEARP